MSPVKRWGGFRRGPRGVFLIRREREVTVEDMELELMNQGGLTCQIKDPGSSRLTPNVCCLQIETYGRKKTPEAISVTASYEIINQSHYNHTSFAGIPLETEDRPAINTPPTISRGETKTLQRSSKAF